MKTLTNIFLAPPHSIEEALKEADAMRQILLQTVANTVFLAPPAGTWSLEHNLYHLHLVERSSASVIRRMAEGEKQEQWSEEAVITTWQRMSKVIPNRSTKIQAPEGLAPQETPSNADCIRLLGESRERLHLNCSKTTTEEMLRTAFPHPVLGALPGLLWITFIPMHEARHLEQILELPQQS
jgi:DinB superfamily